MQNNDTSVVTRKPVSTDDDDYSVIIKFPKVGDKPGTSASAAFTLQAQPINEGIWPFICTKINGDDDGVDADGGIKILFNKDPIIARMQVCTLTITFKNSEDAGGEWQFDQTADGGILRYGIGYCPGGNPDLEKCIGTVLSADKKTLILTISYPGTAGTALRVADFYFAAMLVKNGTKTRYVSKDPKIANGDDH